MDIMSPDLAISLVVFFGYVTRSRPVVREEQWWLAADGRIRKRPR